MPSSKRWLSVQASDMFAEISIVDSSYRVVGRDRGYVSILLAPGLYVIYVRTGDTTEQRTVALSDKDLHESFQQEGPFWSSASLGVGDDFLAVDPSTGIPCWIFIAARVESSEGYRGVSQGWFPEISLCTLDGLILQDPNTLNLQMVPSGHRGAVLPVPPGWYALMIRTRRERQTLLPIFVHENWSPSIFFVGRESEGQVVTQLDRTIVSYDEREWRIWEVRDKRRALELARRSLLSGENLLESKHMEVLFTEKFRDPMLGVLAGHMLLMNDQLDMASQETLRKVVENTGKMLGDNFPDVIALREEAAVRGVKTTVAERYKLEAPPMLYASWRLLLKSRKDDILSSRLLTDVATKVSKGRVWFNWAAKERKAVRFGGVQPSFRRMLRSTPFEDVEQGLTQIDFEGADKALSRVIDAYRASGFTDEQWDLEPLELTLTPLEVRVLRACLQVSERGVPKGYASQLATALEVPEALVIDAARSLTESFSLNL